MTHFCMYCFSLLARLLWMQSRNRQRFFEQVGHETMFVSCGNTHFFPKSCHRQTYQNYEQPPQRLCKYFLLIFTLKDRNEIWTIDPHSKRLEINAMFKIFSICFYYWQKLAKWVKMIDRILISISLPSKLLIRKLRIRKLQILDNLPYIFVLGTLLLAECTLYVCNG